MAPLEITFVNHASVQVQSGDIALLCDPWYQGDAFHKGWNLLSEPSPEEITALLNTTTHLWISHEHPDHFSIPFFKQYQAILKSRGIKVIFQPTDDKRVIKYLVANGLDVSELVFDKPVKLGKDFRVTCLKDGFLDSGLMIETANQKILNLNDCDVKTQERADQIFATVGVCDVLLTQFSYAAWKGGKDNKAWRELAAREKLNTVALQVATFQPKFVIPFASFVYFSNQRNFYLNDSVNHPGDVVQKLNGTDTQVLVMQPFDVFDGVHSPDRMKQAVSFWQEHYDSIEEKPRLCYEPVDLETLRAAFTKYQQRVFTNNSRWFMTLVRKLMPIKVFAPIVIRLDDLDLTVEVDLFGDQLAQSKADYDLSMSSESLRFVFANSFGFDTLSVNGCFEEGQRDGYSKAAKSLAIENLNNLGIEFRPAILLNMGLIMMFLGKLRNVAKKVRLGA